MVIRNIWLTHVTPVVKGSIVTINWTVFQAPSVSRNLEGVLASMCDVDPDTRITLKQIIQVSICM